MYYVIDSSRGFSFFSNKYLLVLVKPPISIAFKHRSEIESVMRIRTHIQVSFLKQIQGKFGSSFDSVVLKVSLTHPTYSTCK